MPTPRVIADSHQRRVIEVAEKATERGLKLWERVDFAQLDASWAVVGPAIVQHANLAQLTIVNEADRYTSALAIAYGVDRNAERVVPESLIGIDGSGRPVSSLLHGAVTSTKQAVGAGLSRVQAFEVGASFLAAMMKTALADIGRSADLTSATAKNFTRYVRVVNAGACSRCAQLAGIDSYKVAFDRHPACKCTTAPIVDGQSKVPAGFHETPEDYFESLTEAEQNRIFTKGGAEAIRSGANVSDVVSARRGASGISTSRGIGRETVPNSGRRIFRERIGTRPDGTPIMGVTTSEGTYRGLFRSTQDEIGVGSQRLPDSGRYSATKRARLMPETIVGLTDDLPTRQLLLRDAGYLDFRITDTSSNSWVAERRASRIADRAAADEFYRKLGIRLG